MSEKSYVTMEQHLCVVCGRPYDTGALLLDKRLRERFERHTLTGWGMCADHEVLRQDDYVALVGCDESKSTLNYTGTVEPENAHRTGAIAHLRRPVFEKVFNVDVPEQMVCFCDEEVIELLKAMEKASEEAESEDET